MTYFLPITSYLQLTSDDLQLTSYLLTYLIDDAWWLNYLMTYFLPITSLLLTSDDLQLTSYLLKTDDAWWLNYLINDDDDLIT